MHSPPLFNDTLKTIHRARAAKCLPGHEALLHEAANRLAEKFGEEITGSFPTVLEIGGRDGYLEGLLKEKISPRIYTTNHEPPTGNYHLITSCLALHWVNDLPGCLRSIHSQLKPGGLFLANLLGGETLKELRASLMEAELALTGGTSPRISPFTLVKDAGMLLSRAGFVEPVAYGESITVLYKDIYGLIGDLRALGETNALASRNRKTPPRGLFTLADRIYKEKFGTEEGYIQATFDLITLTGWK